MDTNDHHYESCTNNDNARSEARTDDVESAAPRVVITGIDQTLPHDLTDNPTVGERITCKPGYDNNAELVQHPLSNPDAPPDAAIIDWFAVTVNFTKDYRITDLILDIAEVFGIEEFCHNPKGWLGYEKRADLGDRGKHGVVAWGGESQKETAHFELNGQGCALVRCWQAPRAWAEARKARITRIDLAHDDYAGTVWNADRVQAEHVNGDGFKGTDGKKPLSSMVGDWDYGIKGRTYYVGSRAAGKMLRCYEKGKQLGELDNPWFRVELELKATNRLIPLNVLTSPGQYLAGSYPCLSSLSSTPCVIETSIKAASINYDKTLAHLKKQWGQFITLVMMVMGNETEALKELSRPGIPERFTPQLEYLLRSRDRKKP